MMADYFSYEYFLGSSDGVRLRDEVVLSLSKIYCCTYYATSGPAINCTVACGMRNNAIKMLNSLASAPAAELVCAYQRYVYVIRWRCKPSQLHHQKMKSAPGLPEAVSHQDLLL